MKTIYHSVYQQLITLLILERKYKKLTQADVAKILGKPQSYIAKIEKLDRKLDVLEFIEICEVLEIKASEVIKKIE